MPVCAARCLSDGRVPCSRRPAIHQPRLRAGAHGRHGVSATSGTELSVLDRQWRTLRSFDDGPTVDAYLRRGSSALLRAKAHVDLRATRPSRAFLVSRGRSQAAPFSLPRADYRRGPRGRRLRVPRGVECPCGASRPEPPDAPDREAAVPAASRSRGVQNAPVVIPAEPYGGVFRTLLPPGSQASAVFGLPAS